MENKYTKLNAVDLLELNIHVFIDGKRVSEISEVDTTIPQIKYFKFKSVGKDQLVAYRGDFELFFPDHGTRLLVTASK